MQSKQKEYYHLYNKVRIFKKTTFFTNFVQNFHKTMQNLIDIHTHTIVSGHAYNTLSEMIDAAQKAGIKLFGTTEHGPAIPGACHPMYFRNMHIVPRRYGDMRLLMGAELNIIDYDGTLDLTDMEYLKDLEIIIAGLHSLCYTDGNKEQNTSALIGAIDNPLVNIISHPCDGTASQLDIEAIVVEAKRTSTLLELNNSSLNPIRKKRLARPYFLKMLEYCKKYDLPIIISSDAHHTSQVADHQYAEPLLKESKFPEALILNDKIDEFLSFIGKE